MYCCAGHHSMAGNEHWLGPAMSVSPTCLPTYLTGMLDPVLVFPALADSSGTSSRARPKSVTCMTMQMCTESLSCLTSRARPLAAAPVTVTHLTHSLTLTCTGSIERTRTLRAARSRCNTLCNCTWRARSHLLLGSSSGRHLASQPFKL